MRRSVLIVAWVASSALGQSLRGAITVRLTDLHSQRGKVGCSLYKDAKGFPADASAAVQRIWCPIAQGAATCAFEPVSPGVYAVACFHDENDNGKCDTGLFGIPKEGVVVSNRAHGFMGPPPFDKAKFNFSGAPMELRLAMEY